ncbi:aldo/keto reductase [Lentisphaera profundi]|uniref:Aldo/keto reductase n=1 Tax=Lentisphaera profundi TaxID=1658616 RepID=A0ABY7VYH1_9BACT|nr:aldo/keto reductase [Lentisphaera profundi]WDE99290.1 aldo/keto reductase [Lentisphaera profundi]
MKYKKLGKTGISISSIGIGAWQLGGPLVLDGVHDGHPDPGRDNVIKMIHELGEHGVNFIDTAEQYSHGESERRIGEAIKSQRDRWVISTKFGHKVGEGNRRHIDTSPQSIMPALEDSLRRLQTDYIDVYHYHTIPDLEHLDESAEILNEAKKKGMIRALGISTSNTAIVKELIKRDMLDVVQYVSSLLAPAYEMQELINSNSLGAICRGVMAGGCLSGRYFHSKLEVKTGDRRSWGDEDYSRFQVFEKLIPEDMTMAQLACRFVLDQKACQTIILGAKNLKDYEIAIESVFKEALSKELKLKLSEVSKELGFLG